MRIHRRSKLATFAGTAALLGASVAVAGTIEGTASHPRGGRDLVVYLTNVAGQFPAPSHHAQFDQKGMRFVPFVLPIVKGTTVDYLNSDPFAHNVFTPDADAFNLGTWPTGERRSHTFARAGVYSMLCSIHPEMEAYVVVLDNPYFAVTQATGHFSIANVPDGHYTAKVWGKRLSRAERDRTFEVNVAGGRGTLDINFAR